MEVINSISKDSMPVYPKTESHSLAATQSRSPINDPITQSLLEMLSAHLNSVIVILIVFILVLLPELLLWSKLMMGMLLLMLLGFRLLGSRSLIGRMIIDGLGSVEISRLGCPMLVSGLRLLIVSSPLKDATPILSSSLYLITEILCSESQPQLKLHVKSTVTEYTSLLFFKPNPLQLWTPTSSSLMQIMI